MSNLKVGCLICHFRLSRHTSNPTDDGDGDGDGGEAQQAVDSVLEQDD
jgi:hypothetical protein